MSAPLALYLHFPWCVRKCPYCDFNSHTLKEELPEARYIDALLADARAQAPRVGGRTVQSLFLGGGTPSLFGPQALARLFEGLRQQFPIAPDAEITLEANPATVERGRFAEYRECGINRVSLGAQSFNDDTLKRLGRIHVRADTLRAAEELHACGLSNFNLDLMFALPHQSALQALEDVRMALQLAPAHVSHYQLTLEPGTLFAAQPPPLPDDDLAWQMQQQCQELLAGEGFVQYEVSAFARNGRACRHNLNYWRFGDYLGLGAGAHGKLTEGTVSRSQHLREPRRYLAAAAAGPDWRAVPAADLPFEFMMNALRLSEGFAAEQFSAATGLPLAAVANELDALAAEQLLRTDSVDDGATRWRTTPRGLQFLNEILQRFLPEANSQEVAGS